MALLEEHEKNVASGFRHYSECSSSFPASDKHRSCLKCLGPDHLPQDCELCQSMDSRVLKNRELWHRELFGKAPVSWIQLKGCLCPLWTVTLLTEALLQRLQGNLPPVSLSLSQWTSMRMFSASWRMGERCPGLVQCAYDSCNTAARGVVAGVSIRRQAWLKGSGFLSEVKQQIADLPFTGGLLFGEKQSALQHLKETKSMVRSLAPLRQAPRPRPPFHPQGEANCPFPPGQKSAGPPLSIQW
nr:PREDICTED: uncharacterized protein LOC106704414 [Latimeria chalumnae]|eukprot:XP_014346894.1 PREDICTED: uncharacterized protein LOC106704414 [Latimeria chalumnae]